MSKQNLTVRLEATVIRKARVLAAERGSSISALVSQTIDEMVAQAESYESARRRAIAFLDRSFRFGKLRQGSRDDLHARR